LTRRTAHGSVVILRRVARQETNSMRPAPVLAVIVLLGTLGVAGGVAQAPPAAAAQKPKTLLAVFAHPDDEQVVSPMLARYAREGVKVQLAIVTDGQKGVREHAGIPAGAALATARAAEARCACEKLGIPPPVMMGFEDGGLQVETTKWAVLERIGGLLKDQQPSVVVTWGPDGVTGHNDHRMVSNLVTQVVQRGGPHEPRQLFYAGFSSEHAAAPAQPGSSSGSGVPQWIAVSDGRYLPVRIAYRDEDARAAAESLACHKSQYTPQELADMSRMARALEHGTVRLRPWFVDPGTITDLFE
jgi:LmbE family N-acetylglucosaminyl deacetylase